MIARRRPLARRVIRGIPPRALTGQAGSVTPGDTDAD
jgi:hypothetical protein